MRCRDDDEDDDVFVIEPEYRVDPDFGDISLLLRALRSAYPIERSSADCEDSSLVLRSLRPERRIARFDDDRVDGVRDLSKAFRVF